MCFRADKVEAAGIRHNMIYLFNCACLKCSSKNVTVLGPPQVFDESIYCDF